MSAPSNRNGRSDAAPFVATFPGGGWVPPAFCELALGPAADPVLDRGRAALGWDFDEAMSSGHLDTHPATLPPLLAIICLAQLAVVVDEGSEVRAAVGHSAGDWTAAVAAGSLQLEDAVRLLATRGRLIEEVCGLDQATMLLVVGPSPDDIGGIVAGSEGVWLAARNGRRVTILSVLTEARDEVMRTLEPSGAMVRQLEIPFGSHCPLMEPVVKELARHVAKTTFVAPSVPFVSSVAPRPLETAEDVREILLHNLERTVVWDRAIAELLSLTDVGFIGFGPAKSGSALVRDGGVPRDRIVKVTDPLAYVTRESAPEGPIGLRGQHGHGSADVRERLLSAGFARVVRHGIRKTTLKEIAHDAKCSRPTLYKHFASKDALVKELLNLSVKQHLAELAEELQSGDGDGRVRPITESLEHAFVFAVHALRDDPLIKAVAATEPESLIGLIQQTGPELYGPALVFADRLNLKNRYSEFRNVDPSLVAETLVRLMISYAFVPNLNEEVDDAGVRRLVRETVFRGVLEPSS